MGPVRDPIFVLGPQASAPAVRLNYQTSQCNLMIYVQFKYCTSHDFSQKLLINYQSSQFHCSIAAIRGPSSNVRWQWKLKSSSFFMMLPMWEVLLKRKKPALHLLSSLTWVLVSHQYLCPNKYQNHVWMKTPILQLSWGFVCFHPAWLSKWSDPWSRSERWSFVGTSVIDGRLLSSRFRA